MGEFRNSQVNDLDLYFIFKSKKYMVIIDANDDIRLYDMVACECSELFSELLHIAWLDCCERIPCL